MNDAKITLKVLAVLLLLCVPVAAQELIPLVPSPPLLPVAPAPVVVVPVTVTTTTYDWSTPAFDFTTSSTTIIPTGSGYSTSTGTWSNVGGRFTYTWSNSYTTVTPTWGLQPVIVISP